MNPAHESQIDGPTASSGSPDSFDAIAEDLRLLRVSAGDISYAEIATRISASRQSSGSSPAAARVARTTVFDVFQPGRKRVNVNLITEIVTALGEDEEAVEQWRQRCAAARGSAERVDANTKTRSRVSMPRTPPAHPIDTTPFAAPKLAAPPISAPLDDHAIIPTQRRIEHRALLLLVIVLCINLNIFGSIVNAKLGLPLFLDMIGTAIASIALGPWHGVLVALGTNTFGALGEPSDETLWFGLVNLTGALIWGFGYHRYRLQTPFRFLTLNLVTALACTLMSVPITILVFDGAVAHASASVADSILAGGYGLVAAFFFANLISSVADKLVSGYLALLASRLLAPLRLNEPSLR